MNANANISADAEKDEWVRCSVCGKKLMRRLDNGSLEFKFGEYRRGVSMVIEGNVTMRCLRKSCIFTNRVESITNINAPH